MDSPLDFRHHSLDIGGNSISFLRYGQEVEIWPRPFNHFYLVTIIIEGSMEVRSSAGRDIYRKQQLLVVNPQDQISMKWSPDCETITLRLERAVVDWILLRDLGIRGFADVRFRIESRIGETGHARIINMIDFLVKEFDFFSATNSKAACHAAPSVLQDIVTHLGVHHLEASSPACRPPGVPATSRYVRRAERCLKVAPESVASVPDLAERVGTHVRTLQIHCKRDLGMSPRLLMANAKLDSIRASLLLCSPGTTVTSAAGQAGWTQLGKLGACYRRRFGELPSDTLKRVRSYIG